MSAQIIPFSACQAEEWPSGKAGEELERLARTSHRMVLAKGETDTLESARRRLLAGYLEMDFALSEGTFR